MSAHLPLFFFSWKRSIRASFFHDALTLNPEQFPTSITWSMKNYNFCFGSMLISQPFSVGLARFLRVVPWLPLLSNGYQAVRHAPGYLVLPLWLVNMQSRYFSSACSYSNLMLSCQLPAIFVNDLKYQFNTPLPTPPKKACTAKLLQDYVFFCKYVGLPPAQMESWIRLCAVLRERLLKVCTYLTFLAHFNKTARFLFNIVSMAILSISLCVFHKQNAYSRNQKKRAVKQSHINSAIHQSAGSPFHGFCLVLFLWREKWPYTVNEEMASGGRCVRRSAFRRIGE